VVMCREVMPDSIGRNVFGGREQLLRLSDLVSRLSHDVRNPLASVLAGLQALERAGSLSPDDLFILGLVIGEARAAIRIIEHFSTSVRLGTYAVQGVLVERLVQNAVAGLNDLARKKDLSLDVIPGPRDAWVEADEQALGRGLGNLLQNAVDACDRGGLIETGWRVLAEEERQTIFPRFLGDVAVLFGRDDGCGLPQHLPAQAIFDPLVTTKPFAAGLGLPLARHIVEGHGGVLSLHSPLAGGTLFEIFLPLGPRMNCWEVMQVQRSQGGDADRCESCDVRLGKTKEFCWAAKGRSAEPGQVFPPKACTKCTFFGTFNLVSVYKPPLRQ